MIWKQLAVGLSMLLLVACSSPRTVTDDFLVARGPYANNSPNSCGTPSSSHVIPTSSAEAENILVTLDYIRKNPSGELLGRLLVFGSRSLDGRLMMDGSRVQVRFDGVPVRATDTGQKTSPESEAANKSIRMQRIGNFYAAGPNGPSNATVSFLAGAVKLDGRNLALPTVNFQQVRYTYNYRPKFNGC